MLVYFYNTNKQNIYLDLNTAAIWAQNGCKLGE